MMTYFRRTSSLRYNRNDFLTKCTTEVVPVCFSAFLKICDSYFQHHIVVSSCHKNRTGSWTARVRLNIRGGVEQSHPADVGTSALINNFMLFSFCLWLVVVHHHIYNPTHKDLRSEHQTISIAEQFRDFRTGEETLFIANISACFQGVADDIIDLVCWIT